MKICKNGCDGLAFWVVFFFGLILHLVHKWQNYQVLMNRCLFHGLCQFLWLLVINLQFFVVEGFFRNLIKQFTKGFVEGLVWFTSLKMLHRKYVKNYRMTYLAFQSLLLELMLYIILDVVNRWVNSPFDL